MMFTCQEQSSSLPFTCNFHYSYYLNCGYFFTAIIHITLPHCTAQMMDSERVGVLLDADLICLMQNAFVEFHIFGHHSNVMALPLQLGLLTLDEGKEQRLVVASCANRV